MRATARRQFLLPAGTEIAAQLRRGSKLDARVRPEKAITWSADLLIIGTGVSGQLPVMPELHEEASARRGDRPAPMELACRLLCEAEAREVAAILHVTC